MRCQECFSLLRWTGYEGKIRIPYGTLIDEPALKPMAHVFVGSKASWYEILDDLPQYDESPWSGSPRWPGDIATARAGQLLIAQVHCGTLAMRATRSIELRESRS